MSSIKRPQPPGTGRHLSNAAKLAMRDDAVARIQELLTAGPLPVSGIADTLKLKRGTTYAYLHHMGSELRLVHRTGDYDENGRELWALGADHTLPGPDSTVNCLKRQVRMVPAKQLGMFRHWMDVALFGPVRGAAA